MNWVLLSTEDVISIHDKVINPGELPGLARDKSLNAAIERVNSRIKYGLICDVYDLAATYAMAVATGHCFNDADKRTSFSAMLHILELNNVDYKVPKSVADVIIEVAQGNIDETELAEWMRKNTQ